MLINVSIGHTMFLNLVHTVLGDSLVLCSHGVPLIIHFPESLVLQTMYNVLVFLMTEIF